MSNTLYYGDNLQVLRESIKDESIDLVYLDPPFNSNASYNVLFKAKSGKGSTAQITAFEDTWEWGEQAEQAYDDVIKSGNPDAANLLSAMRKFLGDNAIMAYLAMMGIRLIELHRVLKKSGSLYLHCDPTASHYLKLLLDSIFSTANFTSEIVWKRTSAHSSAKRWGPVHDIILFYTKSEEFTWNQQYQPYDPDYVASFYTHVDPNGERWRRSDLTGAGIRHGQTGESWRGLDVTAKGRHWAYPPSVLEEMDKRGEIHWPAKAGGMPMFKRYLNKQLGQPAGDLITDIPPMHNLAEERLGYPTQKPLALLERIISASSDESAVILDPFCGCGTSIHAAQKLKRQWIGIDITHLAIGLIERRLKDAFPGIAFTVEGTPKDFESAVDLAKRDKFQFQWWAVTLVNAVPYGGKKKGADTGIDGYYYCKPDGKSTEAGIVSVKGGESPGVKDVRDLRGVIEREKAPVGVLITLRDPTGPMKSEAAKAGTLETPWGKFARIQVVTVKDLLDGKLLKLPPQEVGAGFKIASKEDSAKQEKLL